MGSVFKYIADEILSDYAERSLCPWCGESAALYPHPIEDEESNREEEMACVKCIQTLPLGWLRPRDDEHKITNLINKKHPKGTKSQDQRFALTVEMADEYRRTPYLFASAQSDDWPQCCGDFTEFIGEAGKTHSGQFDDYQWWGPEDDMAVEDGIAAIMQVEQVPLFRCAACATKYWTFQDT